jgi:3-deoxy-D-manno-octulosonic acid kinase
VKLRTHKEPSLAIVYDAECFQQPDRSLFDPDHWREQGRIAGEAIGRGSALFLDTDVGPVVLRRYLRGGWPSRIIRDRYLFTGWERTRPLAEFRMTARLHDQGLPVPRPLAALCRRHFMMCSGSLMTRRLEGSQPLADHIEANLEDRNLWSRVGRCIRRFHGHGVVHADLNARNILVGPGEGVYLVDFDRARLGQKNERAFAANLRRLRRSLEKVWPDAERKHLEPCWSQLIQAYRETGDAL